MVPGVLYKAQADRMFFKSSTTPPDLISGRASTFSVVHSMEHQCIFCIRSTEYSYAAYGVFVL